MLVARNSNRLPAVRRHGEFDRLFEDIFAPLALTAWEPTGRPFPAVNSWEDEKAYHLEAEVPGLSEKDLEITVLGDELRLAGGREEEKKEDHGSTYHRRERYVGKFSRIFRFPVDIDTSKVEAKFANGVVEITLPKAETALPRKIEVRSS